MTYIFDENTSHHVVHLMQRLDADVLHINDEYGPATLDDEFLPDITKRGLILVTVDHKMRRFTGKDGHGAILAELKTKVLFLPVSFQKGALGVPPGPSIPWNQCAWLFYYWSVIIGHVSKMPQLTLARITDKGKVVPI